MYLNKRLQIHRREPMMYLRKCPVNGLLVNSKQYTRYSVRIRVFACYAIGWENGRFLSIVFRSIYVHRPINIVFFIT
jgi:hypothetical protein